MPNNPTIVSASLDDKELQASINKMVANFDKGLQDMLDHTNTKVKEINEALKGIGNTNFGAKDSNDGAVVKHTKAQNADTEAIEKNIAAQDRQIKKNQEAAMSFDRKANAQQVAIRSANPSGIRNAEELQTMNIQLDLLRERLREARQQYSSFVALAAHATTTGDKGLFQFATEGVHRYEQEVRNLIPQIRTLQSGIQQMGDVIAPQGHTIQNYVNSLQKANPELAALNAQYKSGTSLLQEQSTSYASATQSAQRYTEEVRKQAAAIRATKEWQEKGIANVNGHVFYDAERVKGTKQHIREIGTLEEQILRSMQQQSVAERTNTQEAQQRLDTIKRIAAEARAEMKQYGTSAYYTGYAVQNPYIYAENDARAKGLTIEQQIEQILKEQSKEYERQAEKIEQTTQKRTRRAAQDVDKSFKTTLAQTLGINADEINSTGTSIKNLTAYSKQLQQAWEKLSSAGRKSPFGKQLQEELQLTQLQLQRVRNEASRPISLNFVRGMSEKTLDDIALKIQKLQAYKRGINITDPKQVKELEQVDAKINQLTKDLNKYMSTTRKASEVNNALSRSWNYMKNRLAFYFSVQMSRQFIMELVKVRSEYEMNERALGILIGSAEKGTQVFQELSQMSLVSPYTLIELSAAAKQLTAYDIAARDVVDTTRRLADMASAVGVPIERLTYALGQIKAYGYLNSRDQRMFANAGIPLAGELAKYYTEIEGKLVSTGDVYDRIKKKAVDYNDVMQVMYRMTDEGGKFFDFQAKMADTLKVRIANLTLAWNNLLNDIGKSQQGVLTSGIRGLTVLFRHWQDFATTLRNVAIGFGLAKAAQILYISYTQKVGIATAFADASSKKLVGTMYSLKAGITSLITSPMTWWLLLATAVTSAGMAFYDANQKLKEFNNTLRQGGEENFKNINDFLGQYQDLRRSLGETNAKGEAVSPIKDISNDEAKKAWEAMREQIELSTAASGTYLQSLMSIENVSERLRVGFKLLDDIQQVNAAMKDLESTELEVSQSYSSWWNLWTLQDGMIENIKEYSDEVQHVTHGWENFGKQAARSLVPLAGSLYNIYENFNSISNKLSQAKEDIDDFAQSINKFINREGLTGNPTGVIEAYAQAMKKATAEANLSPEQAFVAQKLIEAERSKAVREALKIRIADENAALAQARDENAKADINERLGVLEAQKAMFDKSLDATRPYWDDFNKYIKERHLSEIEQMFRGAETEQERSIILQSAKWDKAVDKWVREYAKSHKMSYDEAFGYLRQWVKTADMWKITIPLIISTEGAKSVLDTLKEADQAINDAYSGIERLKKRRDELKKQGASLLGTTDKDKEYAKILKEIADKEKEYADAKAKGGISSKEEKADAKAAKAAAAARKKEATAAAKAEREAESELAKALGNEIQLINEARSEYKKLEDAGYETFSAQEIIQKSFSQSVKNINAVLAKNNIPLFDLSKFTGASNPRFLLNMLEKQIKALKNNPRVKAAETQKFEIEFSKVDIDAKAYDSKKIAEGLDNSLSRLKDEYELAIALDADPELGNLFADWMGIDTSVLPRTVQEYAERATKYLNQYLKENKAQLTIPDILNLTSDDMRAFEEGVETARYNKEWVERIKKTYEDAANYRKKDMEETIKGWNSLLEKYSDYQHRLVLVQKNASQERLTLIRKFGSEDEKSQGIRLLDAIKVENNPEEVAKLVAQLKDLANKVSQNDETAIKLNVAIDQKALEETSKITFEEFQKTPQWMMATGDLASMTDNMIKMLIQDLEKYKRVNKKALSTKDLRKLQKTLNALHRQARRGNPFHAIADAMDEAKERASEYDDKIAETEKKLAEYGKLGRELTEEEVQEVERLREEYKRLKQEKQEASKPNAEKIVDSIKEAIGVAQEAIGMFSQMAEAIGGKGMTDAAKNLNKVVNVLQMAASGAAVGAQLGGTTGMAIGATAGTLMGVVTQFADEISGNARINRAIKRSELAVKRLELAYIDLEEAENKAYGTAVVGAKQAVRANKELQLAELRRQLVLEQSRKKKNRDENRILELKQQIKELQYEIKNASVDIINELFGQQSAGDFAEQLVSNMIDAFRQGEDYMKSFYDSFDEMVDNMIMKSITSRVVADYIDAVWEDMEDRITKRSDDEAKAYADAQLDVSNYEAFTDKDAAEKQRKVFFDFWNSLTKEEMIAYYKQYYKGENLPPMTSLSFKPMMAMQQLPELYQKVWDDYTDNLYATEKSTKKALDKATAITDYDINYIMDKFSETLPELGEQLKSLIGQYYNIGDKSEKQLSSLQQGLQSMSEDTAGALEAYMNGVSQQCYLQSDLLTQIRDAVVTMDVDVQTGVQAQMLLQLQQSYAVQMAIQGILEGWNNPSGQAVRVELVS